jgi:acetyl esterase/lipase
MVGRRVARREARPVAHEPKGVRTPFSVRYNASGWPIYQTGADRGNHVVYLHGGAYINQIVRQHWQLIAYLAHQAPAQVTVPIYPLAPRGGAATVVPQTADLLAEVIAIAGAGRVTVMGDSAGGGLALAAAQLLRDTGRPQPHGLVLIAPWLDVTMTHPDQPHINLRDPMLDIAGLAEAGRLYAGDLSPTHPWCSPIRGRLDGLAPISAFIGTDDILLPDSLALADHADVHVTNGMPHVYPLLPMPEGRAARAHIAKIVAAA